MARSQEEMMRMQQGANQNPLSAMPPEARENLMKPSDSIAAVLMSRLANMSPEELKMLDSVITPEVARVLMKLLPELQKLIDAVMQQQGGGQQPMQQGGDMGALGGIR
jgi:hypothetical protein